MNAKETSMTTPNMPNLSEFDDDVSHKIKELGTDQLLALRRAVDTRLEEIRAEVVAQAERLGLAVNGGKAKRRGRKPKDEAAER